MHENSTDEAYILGHPAYINARKMSKLVERQDVVSTCRFILFKKKLNFSDAREACKKVEWPFTHTGTWLADIHTKEENLDLRILLQLAYGIHQVEGNYHRDNWVWVGLEKTINNKKDLKKKERGSKNMVAEEWVWQDGTHPNFTHWMRGMPDQEWKKQYNDFQNHVQVNKRGFWDDTFAAIEAPYVCNYCGKYIVVEEHVSWHHAKQLCTNYGLTMAIVNSKEENMELASAAETTFGKIPEKRRWNDTNWIWLGTEEVMDDAGFGTGEWLHHDGSSLQWSPKWDRKRQPDNWVRKRGEQSAVALSRSNWKWDDSFPWKKRPFACMCPYRSCSAGGRYRT